MCASKARLTTRSSVIKCLSTRGHIDGEENLVIKRRPALKTDNLTAICEPIA
jgi:hypothetical protein